MGRITYIASINVLLAPHGYLLTVTAEITHEKKRLQMERVPITLAQSLALLAQLQMQLPSIRHIVGMWDSIYWQIDNGEVKNMFSKLLQVEGQDYNKGNGTLLKDIVLTLVEKSLPASLKTLWTELQKSGLQRIQEQIF